MVASPPASGSAISRALRNCEDTSPFTGTAPSRRTFAGWIASGGKPSLPGSAYAEILIPRMNLDMVVVQGTGTLDLEKGPGHYTQTADPWDAHGRVGIAGHRTTYLAPFWSLDKLTVGDAVILRTKYGTYHYDVTGSRTISPSDASVLDQTTRPTLVLTTCTPRFSASERLIVFADRTSG